MGSSVIQMVSVGLGILSLIAAIVTCVLPSWKVTSFKGQNIITLQEIQDGLWMSCVYQSTGQQQCKAYDSRLNLSSDLQAARVMTIMCCMLSVISLLVLFTGAEFTRCVKDKDAKMKIFLTAGIGMILAGLLLIISVRLVAQNIVSNQQVRLGPCIFIGWAGGMLHLLLGALLCCFIYQGSGGSRSTATYYSNIGTAVVV